MKWSQFFIIFGCMFFMWKVNIDLEDSRHLDNRNLLKEIIFETKKIYVETTLNRLEHRPLSEEVTESSFIEEETAKHSFRWKAKDNFWKWKEGQ